MMTLLTIASVSVTAENRCEKSNGYITSKVDVKAQASFLHTTQHHWKFEFWKGTVCWGKPDQHHQDKQDFEKSSNQCEGNINFNTSRNNQKNYTPVALSWGANLTDGDTFTVNLSDERIAAAYETHSSKCTTHKYGTKLEKASVVYETKAVINVPEDVWVVQVRASGKYSQGESLRKLKPTIGRKIMQNDKDPAAFLQALDAEEWTYLYVEPGEALELALSYSNQDNVGAKKYDIRYDFKFIGNNRCVEVFGGDTADKTKLQLSPKYIEKVINAEIESEADYHNYAVQLGCLRNPVIL